MKQDELPLVLDVCCGPRMLWFNPKDPRACFVDNRRESLVADSRQGRRAIHVAPDVLADFTSLPFQDSRFYLVVFDPPHLTRNGVKSWMGKKYGTLSGEWQEMLRKGFVECFRVLKPKGTLIFKWNDGDIPVSRILALTPERPLFGNRCGKNSRSHWIVFLKP